MKVAVKVVMMVALMAYLKVEKSAASLAMLWVASMADCSVLMMVADSAEKMEHG